MTKDKSTDDVSVGTAVASSPKKRARIVKRDTDHVYSATQDQGERFDSVDEERAHKKAAVAAAKVEKAAAIHALESEVLVPPKKNRGRPSKEYLAAQQAYEEALARRQHEIDEAKAALAGHVGPAIEEPEETAEPQIPADTAVESHQIHAEEDVPEFIRMQQSAIADADAAKDEALVDNIKDLFSELQDSQNAQETEREDNEVTPEETAVDNEKAALLAELTKAYDEGRRMVIVKDVPPLEDDEFDFTYEEDNYAEPVRFRRFKDDYPVEGETAEQIIAATPATEETPAEQSANTAVVQPTTQPLRQEVTIETEGVVELENNGSAYLRSSDYNYMPSPDDVFVSQQQVRNYALKTGDVVYGVVRMPGTNEKCYALKEVLSINGKAPHEVRDRIAFEHLTPLFPDEQFKLSKRGEKSALSCRIVDLFAPIGKGQRALIVAQPKTGKTILMKQIANAIAANYPETYLMMLLIDERPEEVTDMARTVNAEVIASTFDEPAKRHVRIANMVLEKAKRMVECGHDVVIFLDSITRLARAYNTEAPASGKILTGGVDANALQKPKRFFGAARNIEGGGSLTIIATALIDTGSKMDEVIFEEFKGTGNMELQLDRNLANKRIFPAVNVVQSSTRREDLLLDETTINRMFITRNYMSDMSPVEAMNFIKKQLESTISNEEFIATMGGI